MPAPHRPAASSLEFLRSSTVFSRLSPQLFDIVASECEWVSFEQGEVLFAQGDESDRFFVVVHGRLAVSRTDAAGVETFIGWVTPGESVGEMALLEGGARTATVRAAHATVAIGFARDKSEALTARAPECLTVLNQLLIARLRHVMAPGRDRSPAAEILAVVAASQDAPLAEFSARLCATLEREGAVLHLSAARLKALLGEDVEAEMLDDEQRGRLLTWLNGQETRHRFIVLEADAGLTPWTARCLRHADQVLHVARADGRSAPHVLDGRPGGPAGSGIGRPRRLILIQRDDAGRPSGTSDWLDALQAGEHHHVRLGVAEDMERLGRFIRRRPVTLALAGGAALGFAHIGVLRALSEAGIPIDLVCGTSMGAIVSGQVALGMSWEDVFRETRRHFRGNSIYDATLPVISFFKARRMDARLQLIVGDAQIEDLWVKYFCVSSNLTRAAPEVHERGSLKRAMRASSAVPGLFPPLLKANGEILVDGALVNNLPADLAVARHGGSAIAVNVIPTIDQVTTGGYREGASAFRALLSRTRTDPQLRSPTIVDLLMRSVFLPTVSAAGRIRADASLYIEPPLERFGFLNTKRFDEIVETGYRAAQEKLSVWRPSL